MCSSVGMRPYMSSEDEGVQIYREVLARCAVVSVFLLIKNVWEKSPKRASLSFLGDPLRAWNVSEHSVDGNGCKRRANG